MRVAWISMLAAACLSGFVGECDAQKVRFGKDVRIEGVVTAVCPGDAEPKCKFDVEVEPIGANGCSVFFNFGSIESRRRSDGQKNVLVWRLFTIDGKRSEYSFATKGIDIQPPPGADDFDTGGFESNDKKRFKWRSINNRDGSFRFEIKVVRTVGATTTACDPYDPTIVNRGG